MVSIEHDASEVNVLPDDPFLWRILLSRFLQRYRSLDHFQLDSTSFILAPYTFSDLFIWNAGRPKKFQSFVRKPFEKCISDSECALEPYIFSGSSRCNNQVFAP